MGCSYTCAPVCTNINLTPWCNRHATICHNVILVLGIGYFFWCALVFNSDNFLGSQCTLKNLTDVKVARHSESVISNVYLEIMKMMVMMMMMMMMLMTGMIMFKIMMTFMIFIMMMIIKMMMIIMILMMLMIIMMLLLMMLINDNDDLLIHLFEKIVKPWRRKSRLVYFLMNGNPFITFVVSWIQKLPKLDPRWPRCSA